MPLVESIYNPPYLFKNGFFSTVYSGLVRKVKSNGSKHIRERFILSDGDFIDLDWGLISERQDKLVILLHGLEGSSDRPYMLGASNLFNQSGFNTLRMNFRGCSGEENRKYRSYHSGDTGDLKEVLSDVLKKHDYNRIFLNGYSLGGNVILKYLGEENNIPEAICGAVAISVPCDLKGSAYQLLKLHNRPYAIRFKRHLLRRLREKQKQFPEMIKPDAIKNINTLIDFDHQYTAKAHGFKDAFDYYKKSSSLQYLNSINKPTLIINAQNDSFLSEKCYPVHIAKENPNLYLEMPIHGGHVGFYTRGEYYYNEIRSLEFFRDLL